MGLSNVQTDGTPEASSLEKLLGAMTTTLTDLGHGINALKGGGRAAVKGTPVPQKGTLKEVKGEGQREEEEEMEVTTIDLPLPATVTSAGPTAIALLNVPRNRDLTVWKMVVPTMRVTMAKMVCRRNNRTMVKHGFSTT